MSIKDKVIITCAVTLVRDLIESQGYGVAGSDEARAILHLKGAANVNF